jgi:hypothetical protein
MYASGPERMLATGRNRLSTDVHEVEEAIIRVFNTSRDAELAWMTC